MDWELEIFLPIIQREIWKLKNKHIQILNFYDFEYELDEMESNWFNSLDTLKDFLI